MPQGETLSRIDTLSIERAYTASLLGVLVVAQELFPLPPTDDNDVYFREIVGKFGLAASHFGQPKVAANKNYLTTVTETKLSLEALKVLVEKQMGYIGTIAVNLGNCVARIVLLRMASYPIEEQMLKELRELTTRLSINPSAVSMFLKDYEPMHFVEALHKENPMSNISFNAPITGNVNVAGNSIIAPVQSITFGDILARIESSSATESEKQAAKSKLTEFLSHPLVAAVVGGLAGGIGA